MGTSDGPLDWNEGADDGIGEESESDAGMLYFEKERPDGSVSGWMPIDPKIQAQMPKLKERKPSIFNETLIGDFRELKYGKR